MQPTRFYKVVLRNEPLFSTTAVIAVKLLFENHFQISLTMGDDIL